MVFKGSVSDDRNDDNGVEVWRGDLPAIPGKWKIIKSMPAIVSRQFWGFYADLPTIPTLTGGSGETIEAALADLGGSVADQLSFYTSADPRILHEFAVYLRDKLLEHVAPIADQS